MERLGADSSGNAALSNHGEKRRILLLDDEPDITSVMSVALKSAGFSVDAFNDPYSALSRFEQAHRTSGLAKYHLVISDIRMPLMDGFEFARRINALDNETKVVLITGFEVKRQEFENALPSLRVDALLNKPIGMTKLTDVVRALMLDSLAKEGSAEQAARNSAISPE